MAFSIKQVKAKLQEFGVSAENLDAAAEYFCAAHKTDLDAIKEERDNFRKDAETLVSVRKELDALKAQPGDGYKDKYEKEHKAFEDYKAAAEAEKTMAAKKAAYTDICKDAGLSEKGIAKAVKYADWDKIELDEDGKIKDAKAQIKSIKEEWAEHIVTTSTKGVNTETPPANTGGSYKSREEIYKRGDNGRFVLDANQRQAALAQINAAEQQKG